MTAVLIDVGRDLKRDRDRGETLTQRAAVRITIKAETSDEGASQRHQELLATIQGLGEEGEDSSLGTLEEGTLLPSCYHTSSM